MKYFSFEVVGRGDFPVDMLRYDSAFPADGNAVDAIAFRVERENWRQERTVRLGSYRSTEPTIGRWNSFGWRVINIEKSSIR